MSASADGVTGYGECVADDRSLLPARDATGTVLPRAARLPGAAGASPLDLAHPRELLARASRACAATRWPRRRWRWRCGSCRRAARACRSTRLLGGRGGHDRSRRLHRPAEATPDAARGTVEREVAAGYRRDQDQDQARPRPARSVARACARRFPDAAADGGRQQRLHARRRAAASRELDALRPDDGRAAAGLGRHRRPRGAAARRSRTPVCLDESIRCADDARHALDLGACRIVNIKAGPRGRLRVQPGRARPLPRARRPGLVRRHARVGHRPAGQRAPADAARASRCPATPRPARATSPRTSWIRR